MRRKRVSPIKPRNVYAIVVEGKTEVWYLNMLKRNEKSLNINLEPKIPQKKSLAEQFELVKELAKDYTKVFWIIDLDVVLDENRKSRNTGVRPLQQLIEHRKTIKNNYENVVVIINNPCLEFWFLIHYTNKSKAFSQCKNVNKELRKHLVDYEKTQRYFTKQGNDIYLKLKPNLETGLKNAKRLGEFDSIDPNKSLAEMHLFFDLISYPHKIEPCIQKF